MFDADHYEVRQKISIGNKYNVYEGESDDPILTSAQKKFRLKEDFRFLDPESETERFRVKADSVLDVAAAYDIEESETGERVGSVRRSVKSMFKHEYELLDGEGDVVGVVKEDSVANAVIRRFVTSLVPFSYVIEGESGEKLGEVTGAFSLRDRYSIDLSGDIDPRLVVIATVVIDAIEAN